MWRCHQLLSGFLANGIATCPEYHVSHLCQLMIKILNLILFPFLSVSMHINFTWFTISKSYFISKSFQLNTNFSKWNNISEKVNNLKLIRMEAERKGTYLRFTIFRYVRWNWFWYPETRALLANDSHFELSFQAERERKVYCGILNMARKPVPYYFVKDNCT